MNILCKKTILIYILNINFFLLPLISSAHSEKPSKTSLYSESAGVFRVEIENDYEIQNTNRAVGTRISYHLYKKFGEEKIEAGLIVAA